MVSSSGAVLCCAERYCGNGHDHKMIKDIACSIKDINNNCNPFTNDVLAGKKKGQNCEHVSTCDSLHGVARVIGFK